MCVDTALLEQLITEESDIGIKVSVLEIVFFTMQCDIQRLLILFVAKPYSVPKYHIFLRQEVYYNVVTF